MKITGFKSQFLLILISPLLFIACNNDDAGEDFDAFADVFIVKKKVNGVDKTANAYYVYGNNVISSATAVPPEDLNNQVSLTAVDDQKYDYYYEPDSTEFNLVPPVAGNYIFEIESARGEIIQKSDLLKAIDPMIPEIVATNFNKSTLTLSVKWNKVTDTDGFFIKLLNKEGDIHYISNALSTSTTEFHIGTVGGNWMASVNMGDELVLQIQSVVIEDDADENYSLYNIEAIATAEKVIIWGE